MNGSCKVCCDVRVGEWGTYFGGVVLFACKVRGLGLGLGLGVPDRPNHDRGYGPAHSFLYTNYQKFQYLFKAAAELCKKVFTEGRVD